VSWDVLCEEGGDHFSSAWRWGEREAEVDQWRQVELGM